MESGSALLCATEKDKDDGGEVPDWNDGNIANCFDPPQPGGYSHSVSNETFADLTAAGEACQSNPACGAVMLEDVAGQFTLRSAHVLAVLKDSGWTLWRMSSKCAGFVLVCLGDGKRLLKKSSRALRGFE